MSYRVSWIEGLVIVFSFLVAVLAFTAQSDGTRILTARESLGIIGGDDPSDCEKKYYEETCNSVHWSGGGFEVDACREASPCGGDCYYCPKVSQTLEFCDSSGDLNVMTCEESTGTESCGTEQKTICHELEGNCQCEGGEIKGSGDLCGDNTKATWDAGTPTCNPVTAE